MKKITKTLALIISLAMVMIMLPVTAMADGSYYVDTTYLTMNVGETATVTITAENAAGRVDWSGSGAVTSSGSAYLDNGDATISITAESAGTGYVNVVPTDIATYDGEELSNSYTIQVEVAGQNGGNADNTDNNEAAADNNNTGNDATPQEDNRGEEDAPAEVQAVADDNDNNDQKEAEDNKKEETREPAAAKKTLTDSNKDYADLDEDSRLYTDVEDQELYIIQFPRWLNENNEVVWNDEVYGLDLLEGFDLVTVNYKDMDVDTFQYKDMLNVFVLKNFETDQSNYYLLEDGVGFTQLKYITANGKQYIVVDFPSDFVIPEGYQMVELTFGNNTVMALKMAGDSADSKKEFEIEVSPGLDTVDPTADIYYIYCLVDGKTQLYSYDSGENTLQRASLLVYKAVPTEPETVIVYETVTAEETTGDDSSFLKGIGWNGMQVQVKILLIALAAAILLIIILIILFAAMSKKNKKNNKNNSNKSNKNNKNNKNKNNSKNNNKKQSGNKKSKDDIPERTTNRAKTDDVEESFFSYVKTEKDPYEVDDLNL